MRWAHSTSRLPAVSRGLDLGAGDGARAPCTNAAKRAAPKLHLGPSGFIRSGMVLTLVSHKIRLVPLHAPDQMPRRPKQDCCEFTANVGYVAGRCQIKKKKKWILGTPESNVCALAWFDLGFLVDLQHSVLCVTNVL